MIEYLIYVLIASSFFITIYPMVLLQQGYDMLSPREQAAVPISVTTLNLLLPILMGALFPFLYKVIRLMLPRNTGPIHTRYAFTGALCALIVSILYDTVIGMYSQWFGVNPLMAHVYVFVFYFVVFQVVGMWLYVKINETLAPSSSGITSSVSHGGSSSSSKSSSGSISSRSSDSSGGSSVSSSSGSSQSSSGSSSARAQDILDKYKHLGKS